PPDVARIKRAVADLRAATGDDRLAARVQLDLAVAAFLDGHHDQAERLLPAGVARECAAAHLRDMTLITLDEGGPGDRWPARRAGASRRGAGGGAPRAPPGLGPLMPDGGPGGYHVPPAERASAGLPPRVRPAEKAVAPPWPEFALWEQSWRKR